MAIAQTGSVLQFGISDSAEAGTVSSTITVPSDATLVVVGVSGYRGYGEFFDGMTFSKGGTDTAMTRGVGGDLVNNWMCALFYLALPDTGTGKTLKWDWADSSSDANLNFSVTFWKGVDTSSPVRDSGGVQASTGWPVVSTSPLIAEIGDKVLAFAGFYSGAATGSGAINSWLNLTELAEIGHQAYAEGAWATADPPTGSRAVGITTATDTSEGGLAALVLTAGPGTAYLTGVEATASVGAVSVVEAFSLPAGPLYHVTVRLGSSDIATLDTTAPFADEAPAGYAEWLAAGAVYVPVSGVGAVASVGTVTVIAEGEVEPPVIPIIGGGGGTIPKKQLRKAVRELLRREEKRRGRKKPKVLAREILEAIEAKGLGVQEKRLAIRLIGEALRLELPSLFYSQPIIHDKGEIARAILFIIERAMLRLQDDEEDEEAALLLLSAA